MNARKIMTCATLALLTMVLSMSWAAAQDQRPERPRRDPEQWRQRINDFYKQQLGVTDAEWKVIQPRIEKVQTLSREATPRMGLGRGRGRGNEQREEPTTATGKAVEKLRKLMEDENAKPDDIKAALTELRSAREKAKVELDKARQELKEIVTVKQEARLVMMGILE